MFPKQTENTENGELTQEVEFKHILETILNCPLSPENVDMYAEDALVKLITLTDKVTKMYTTIYGNRETADVTEDAAYESYGLDNIPGILDHIIAFDKDIKSLDLVINAVDKHPLPEVITPADIARSIIAGNGSFDAPSTIPRLKTLLLMLMNDFDIDPEDTEKIRINKGILESNMMRRESYYSIELTTLNRIILVCNEEGNATFVFDHQKLLDNEIEYERLIHLTKEELKQLIDAIPAIGQRIIYNPDTFVPRMSESIQGINDTTENRRQNKATYLIPRAPDGFRLTRQIAEQWGVSQRTVSLAAEAIKEDLVPIKLRINSNTPTYYSPEDQEKIWVYLDQKGIFAPKVTDEQKSVLGMSEEFGVSRAVIGKAIIDLIAQDVFGEVLVAKYNSYIGPTYGLEQQALVRKWLGSEYYRRQRDPKKSNSPQKTNIDREIIDLSEYSNQLELADELNTTRSIVGKIQESVKNELGEVLRISGQLLYSPLQKRIIKRRLAEYIDQNPRYSSETPGGYQSRVQLGKVWDIHLQTFDKGLAATESRLGAILRVERSSNPSNVYSPEQQEIIYGWLVENKLIAGEVPTGYLSVRGISTKLGYGSQKVIIRAIEGLGLAIGEPFLYKNYARIGYYYSPYQQEQIRGWIVEHVPNSKLAQAAMSGS